MNEGFRFKRELRPDGKPYTREVSGNAVIWGILALVAIVALALTHNLALLASPGVLRFISGVALPR